jgi:hypothetical protein
MADFKKMTLESLRDLARKALGASHSRYKTKRELIEALERAGEKGASTAPRAPARARATAPATAGTRAVKAAKKAGTAARAGVRAVARAGKAAADGAAEGAKEAVKAARARKPGKVGTAVAAVAGAAAGAVASVAAAAGRTGKPRRPPGEAPDPEGYFVARVRGEDAVREAPHPMTETTSDSWAAYEEGVGPAVYDEGLGELPWSYGDDAFVALPRDPRTLFVYWDHARETLARAFEGLEHPRAQLWVFARSGAGWDRLRTVDFALESRGYYVHDLEPGRTYRAEIHAVDRAGHDRLVGASSNEVTLPAVGPSPIVDDRFVRIPWEMPLGRLLGPGHAGGPFPDEARALLSRLSDWSRFAGGTWGGSAGGMGGRPSSPTSSPSGPFGPSGGDGESGQ